MKKVIMGLAVGIVIIGLILYIKLTQVQVPQNVQHDATLQTSITTEGKTESITEKRNLGIVSSGDNKVGESHQPLTGVNATDIRKNK